MKTVKRLSNTFQQAHQCDIVARKQKQTEEMCNYLKIRFLILSDRIIKFALHRIFALSSHSCISLQSRKINALHRPNSHYFES